MCCCDKNGCDCGCGCQCDCDGDCDCHGGVFRRQFQTKAEKIEMLECYLEELKLEVQAVEEQLADLRGPAPAPKKKK